MLKELYISIYLYIFRSIFNIFKVSSLKNKIVIVNSFEDSSLYLIKQLQQINNGYSVVILDCRNSINLSSTKNISLVDFRIKKFYSYILGIYHLATSRYVIVDNYYGFLSTIDFKQSTTCIQIWHANGAFKKFGLEDNSIKQRTNKSLNRFSKVYESFDFVVAGSEPMAEIFKNSFGLNKERIIKLGFPRSDFFFDARLKEYSMNKLYNMYPWLKNKKIILYAPTYRENDLNRKNVRIELDLKQLNQSLSEEYVILLKLHPSLSCKVKQTDLPNSVYDFSDYESINTLLLISEILITDYSSIPFEYAILKKPIIFYPYDIETYKFERGLIENYEKIVPGPIAMNTNEIINIIKDKNFDYEKVYEFNSIWNKFSDGHACNNLIEFIYGKQNIRQKVKDSDKIPERI